MVVRIKESDDQHDVACRRNRKELVGVISVKVWRVHRTLFAALLANCIKVNEWSKIAVKME